MRKPWWKSKKIWVLVGTLFARLFGAKLGLDPGTVDSVSTVAFTYVGLEAGMDTVDALSGAISERGKR